MSTIARLKEVDVDKKDAVLINASRNRHRYQHIVELKGDYRRKWSAGIKLLHGEAVNADEEPAEIA